MREDKAKREFQEAHELLELIRKLSEKPGDESSDPEPHDSETGA